MQRLIDTSAFANFRRGDPAAADAIQNATALFLSVVVVGEMLAGFRQGDRYEKNIDDLRRFIRDGSVRVLPVTEVTADRYAQIVTMLREAGTPIPTNDVWIAAHAMQFNLQIVTYDRHFSHLPQLSVRLLSR